MNVFDFRQHIVAEYAQFTRSFTRIKADDIQSHVTSAYDSQRYWPEPLIQVNPIVDDCLKAKQVDPTPRIRAIVIYPMNALANSQLEELKKFLGSEPGQQPVTFGRYTGQERDKERVAMAANPPDILLTNFMMLELLMTRQNDIDRAVMRHAKGLRFLVLDELHTYRGRQGADVALLVRRVREALGDQLIFIGTSATMASDGTEQERNARVADVATRLFGTLIPARNIITETLQPGLEDAAQALCRAHSVFHWWLAFSQVSRQGWLFGDAREPALGAHHRRDGSRLPLRDLPRPQGS